jgi:hypothetical protein
LEFNRLEHEVYFNELNKNKSWNNFSDRFILEFEKIFSDFGTNIKKSIFYFIFFNLFIFVSYGICYDYSFDKLIIPFKADIFTFFHFLTLIINPFLIYEIIKSFRKYSRKL